ncbi:hypothetical protein DYB30_006445 [Aphanomyces astaci]|uniref:Uncharacterized protein n=2 Tax=Aphanomyces astaci TaxID=112090 RepID=A0A397F5N4_APHAT|nr:hypothetical protein DYB38_006250 [Aphanomyces astaci]RHY57688.1 hypothetical protein DYB30_006445 [Aphanomyces astaci]RHZ11186.1 hypothetical protein DYB31_005051 [Aphanomyces astaci]
MQNVYFPQPTRAESPSKDGKSRAPRADGRSGDEFRGCFMRCGVLSHAAGSAYVEFGQTRVVCAVYGPRAETNPRQTKGQPITCEIKLPSTMATFESEFGNLMRQALEPAILVNKFPKCQVSIHAVVLEGHGSELSAAITCASLALVDAGVEMIDMVAACSAGEWDGNIVLDPTADEQTTKHVLVAFMAAQGQITHLIQQGKLSYDRVQEAISLCTDGCAGVLSTMMQMDEADFTRRLAQFPVVRKKTHYRVAWKREPGANKRPRLDVSFSTALETFLEEYFTPAESVRIRKEFEKVHIVDHGSMDPHVDL